MSEKKHAPLSDTIHNLKVVREALEAEGLTVHVKLIDQAIEDISAAPQAACCKGLAPTWECRCQAGSAPQEIREAIVKECAEAARDGFEAAMKNYVLTGPGGMAMQMINSIKALSRPESKP